jgi:putative FmdB family regulatory protein
LPVYTYACKQCGADLERRQTFSDAPLTVCETCGGELRRVLHPVGVIFKGSGFYNTDNRKSSGGSSSDSDKDGAKEPAKTGDSKDTKPAKSEVGSSTKSEPAASAAGKKSTE